MANSSEGLASTIVTDVEILELIRLEETEFYGTTLAEEEIFLDAADDSDEDELLSLSDDEASTRQALL